MTYYPPSRIDRLIARSLRYRKKCLVDDDVEKDSLADLVEDEDVPHNDTYELRPDEAGDGRIIRKRIND